MTAPYAVKGKKRQISGIYPIGTAFANFKIEVNKRNELIKREFIKGGLTMANIQLRRGGIRNELERLQNEVDDLFGSFFGRWPSRTTATETTMTWPSLDMVEEEDNIIVNAEVPGCKADDIDLSIHGDVLTISGEKKREKEYEKEGCYRMERSFGKFRRDVTLPSEVDRDKIEAEYKDGLLQITMPKAAETKTKKIQIKGSK